MHCIIILHRKPQHRIPYICFNIQIKGTVPGSQKSLIRNLRYFFSMITDESLMDKSKLKQTFHSNVEQYHLLHNG